MNPPFNQGQQPQREEIVDKLHGALASLRKERDQLHRSKELAVERLRLAKEERLTVEKTVSSMGKTYERLTASVNGAGRNNANDDISTLQREVERLSREASMICAWKNKLCLFLFNSRVIKQHAPHRQGFNMRS